MKKFFSLDNPVFRFLDTAADLVIANILTFVCCIPIITIGTAMAANHYVTQNVIYKNGGGLIKMYFSKFREVFKHTTILWLAQLLVLAVLGVNMYLVLVLFDETLRNVLLVMLGILGFLALAAAAFMQPLIVRYENRFIEHFHNAMLLVLRKFPLALFMVALHIAPIVFAIVAPTAFIASAPVWILGGISLIHLLDNWLLKSTFLQLEAQRDARAASSDPQIDSPVDT